MGRGYRNPQETFMRFLIFFLGKISIAQLYDGYFRKRLQDSEFFLGILIFQNA